MDVRILLIITMLFAIHVAQAKEVIMHEYEYPITRIIDGDTVAFRAYFLPDPLKQELSLRVHGIDSPEKSWRAECPSEKALGVEASNFTEQAIANATDIRVAIYRWDKYGGRVLGDIILDGESLRLLLLANGYAREYFGRTKESWCK